MLITALACDYDGTLASEDRIGPAALGALERAREAGLRLILVTGRTFFELIRVCERLDLFDVVIAENGGVFYTPGDGTIRDQGPPPPRRVLAELDRRGISFHVGHVIVGTARAEEEGVREALAAVGARLAFSYNRDALMLLPAGISKGPAVRQAIRDLALSFHDVLALGDAENDVELFEACGWAACPGNAVPVLRDRADWIFEGQDGAAVAQAILGPILGGSLPSSRSRRQEIPLGWAVKSSEPVDLPARGVNVLIHGDPHSGKSWLAGGLVERLLGRHYAVCVLDPEGDFHVLERLSGITWRPVRDEASLGEALGLFASDPAACVVADLSTISHAAKVRLLEAALGAIRELRRRLGRPHWVFLDEAHYSLHREGIRVEASGIEGRGFCLITYKPSWIRESVLRAVDVLALGRTTVPEELVFLRSFLLAGAGGDAAVTTVLPGLPRGEFLLVRAEPGGDRRALTFLPLPRETPHVRHRKKYADTLLPPERHFCFRGPAGDLVGTVGNLAEFQQALARVEDHVLVHHAQRRDFSRWVLGVFSDQELGRGLRRIEGRWGRGEIADLREAIDRLLMDHYGAEP